MRKTQAEMYPIIEEWESSEMNQKSFCQSRGISLATFSYWRTRYRSSQANLEGFTELKAEPTGEISIVYPNGVRVNLPSATPISTIGALLRLA